MEQNGSELEDLEAVKKSLRRSSNRMSRSKVGNIDDSEDETINDDDDETHDDESDGENNEEETALLNATFSPSTRRSIYGYRHSMAAVSKSEDSDLTDDEDELNESEADKQIVQSRKTEGSSGDFDEDQYLYSPSTRKSIAGNFQKSSSTGSSLDLLKTINHDDEFIQEKINDSQNETNKSRSTPKPTPENNTIDLTTLDDSSSEIEEPIHATRKSCGLSKTKFEESIKEKMSSTLSPPVAQEPLDESSIIEIVDNSYDAPVRQTIQPTAVIEEREIIEVEEAAGVDWEAIKKANAQMQPKYTGKTGLETFQAQKGMAEKCLKNIHGSLQTQPGEDELAETPKQLKVELMDHQRHALAWMMWREEQNPKGGILADDMGLGKTLCMISLILSKLDEEDEKGEDDDSDEEEASGKWMNRGTCRYYPGGTLIVCPASVLGQWQNEITKRVRRGCLTFEEHHGSKREQKPKYLARHDVVITTYNIVLSEQKKDGPLFGVKWCRIILDEAHIIRNHNTGISQACTQLHGRNRWALTGTPICNKKMDLFALLRFLRCRPFDDLKVFKTWVEHQNSESRMHALVKTLMLRRTKAILQEKQQIELPKKTVIVVDVVLSRAEMNVYQKVMLYSRCVFTDYLAQKGIHAHNANDEKLNQIHAKVAAMHGQNVGTAQILTLLLRLRQICCHPGLIEQVSSIKICHIESFLSSLKVLRVSRAPMRLLMS